jgi:hypothetical protein
MEPLTIWASHTWCLHFGLWPAQSWREFVDYNGFNIHVQLVKGNANLEAMMYDFWMNDRVSGRGFLHTQYSTWGSQTTGFILRLHWNRITTEIKYGLYSLEVRRLFLGLVSWSRPHRVTLSMQNSSAGYSEHGEQSKMYLALAQPEM